MDRIAVDIEERAAIREYDGNMTRAEAEKAALEEVNAAWKEYAEKQKGSNNAQV